MAALVNMARSPEALKKDSSYGTIIAQKEPDQPVYPWGLSISLGDEELDKLDLDCDCEIGEEITFVVRCEVTSVSQNKSDDGPKSRLELQIVAMRPLDPPADMMPDNDEDDRKSTRYKGATV